MLRPSKAHFHTGLAVVHGEMLDIESLRQTFAGVSTLFLLNAVAADEYTTALVALNIATNDRWTPILLKKSMTDYLTRFSWVVLSLTEDCERFVARSERSDF